MFLFNGDVIYVCVRDQLLEELCLLRGWAQPQYHAISTLHDGLPVYACRVSTLTTLVSSVLWSLW